ncbi:heavy metal-binding domain-containing protein [Brucepastera parasyntrophica]|uniref:heavy metal-binding domain-containing protein n=1 Tax=Brucepastera parasyntrophica TaxID=2880008 RepID=UPI00210992A4|nr:heavy metal-binding domain-containing protein [Brucepastera parasyntrophica]ULQ59194.1 heavy metal-binding domain-containing protein [Brucepastera parasyntrophica]
MKNRMGFFLSVLVVLCMVFVMSCMTTESVSSESTNIHNPAMGFADLERTDYTTVGKVSGSGTVSVNKDGTVTGDTYKYGYLGYMGMAGSLRQDAGLFSGFGSVSTTVASPSEPVDIARSNAMYVMIENAKAQNADAIIFVNQTVKNITRGSTVEITVEIQGTAIKYPAAEQRSIFLSRGIGLGFNTMEPIKTKVCIKFL